MAKVIDYIRSNGDLVITNGDFAKGDCTGKHQESLIVTEPGDFKQFPTLGVGIVTFLLNESTADEVRTAIQREFEADGMQVNDIVIESSRINVNAEYA